MATLTPVTYVLGAGAPPADPLLEWHTQAAAQGLEVHRVDWRDGELHAADWEMSGLLVSVRANLLRDARGTFPTAALAQIHTHRSTALLTAKRDRSHAGVSRWAKATKPTLAGLSRDEKWRNEVEHYVRGMRYLIWATSTANTTPSQWRKLMRTWRKYPPYYRAAFWPETANTPLAGMAYEPLAGDPAGFLTALRWLPTAEPALLVQTALRMRLRLRGRTSTAPINASDKPIYQWLFEDYERANKAETYGRLYGARR